jgi:hypothetical protein
MLTKTNPEFNRVKAKADEDFEYDDYEAFKVTAAKQALIRHGFLEEVP